MTIRLDFSDVIFSDSSTTEENVAKLMKVAWLTLPIGVAITVSACFFVFWLKGLGFSDPYGQAILINGNVRTKLLLLMVSSNQL